MSPPIILYCHVKAFLSTFLYCGSHAFQHSKLINFTDLINGLYNLLASYYRTFLLTTYSTSSLYSTQFPSLDSPSGSLLNFFPFFPIRSLFPYLIWSLSLGFDHFHLQFMSDLNDSIGIQSLDFSCWGFPHTFSTSYPTWSQCHCTFIHQTFFPSIDTIYPSDMTIGIWSSSRFFRVSAQLFSVFIWPSALI